MDEQQIASKKETRLLIVEDEKDYRTILAERLELEGYKVFQAENGEVALRLLKDTDVDLILLDMLMPTMDGVTFFYQMEHTLQKQIPVIILTNLTEAAYPQGVSDFIIKANTSLDEVSQKIKKHLNTLSTETNE
jgi:DNA-binding response OmpR family regulator